MVKRLSTPGVWLFVATASACGGGGTTDTPAVTTITRTVSTTGTTVELPGGPSLVFDAGAVTTDTAVTIQVSSAVIPSEYALVGAVYDLEPSGLVFPPGTVTLTLPLGSGDGSIWLSSVNGYDALPTTVGGGKASAGLPHFSEVFTGARCAEGSACTPANPCHNGTTKCSGAPRCDDLGTSVADETACCTGGTCTSGFCEAASFDGSWRATSLQCGGVDALASWITPPSIFRVTQSGSTGFSFWTNGACTVQQQHDVITTFACLPSAAACESYAAALFGMQICGSASNDTGSTETFQSPVPACTGGSVTVLSTGDTPCPGSGPLTMTFVRE